MTEEAFYNKFAPLAKECEMAHGVPYLSALAQAAIESGWGEHHPGNMYFGIKATSAWKGKTQTLATTEVKNGVAVRVNATFRAYDTAADSFKDFGQFLRSNKRYSEAFKETDPYAFSKAVALAGYATDPNYYKKIHKVIDTLKKKALLIR